MAVKMTVHALTQGTCCLSQKEGEVLVVSFEDGTIAEGALSAKSLLQLLRMKFAGNGKPAKTDKQTVPVALPASGSPK